MKVVELLGSTLREVGILLLVFAPLELYFRAPNPSLSALSTLMAIGLLLIALGITMEAYTEKWK